MDIRYDTFIQHLFARQFREREIYVDQKSIIDCGQVIIGAAVNNFGLYRKFSGISSSCSQRNLSFSNWTAQMKKYARQSTPLRSERLQV